MKKVVYLAALLVVAGVSFAFLPKNDTVQHAMLVSSFKRTGYGTSEPELYLLTSTETKEIEFAKGDLPKSIQVQQLVIKKLDEMSASGWVLTATHQATSITGRMEASYVLVKHQ